MKLYRVRCQGMDYRVAGGVAHGLAYVVADNPNEAYAILRKYLDQKDLGFRPERTLASVELIAEESDYPECGHHLFIQSVS